MNQRRDRLAATPQVERKWSRDGGVHAKLGERYGLGPEQEAMFQLLACVSRRQIYQDSESHQKLRTVK